MLFGARLASLLLLALNFVLVLAASPAEQAQEFFGNDENRHTNNWAVLVGASRFWFNYRHMSNTLALYRSIKRLGIPDSNIILMLADDVACNPRNIFPATVYGNANKQLDLYGDSVEVDYSGYDVTVESFLRVLTGRLSQNVPPNKRLLSDASSNVFIYLTGHGGDEFLKFQDNEELSAFDIADAVEQMWEKRRYNKLLFMIDTCQANTMYTRFYSPNIVATGSSRLGEMSLSHHMDRDLGIAVIDGYTHFVLNYIEELNKTSQVTVQNLFDDYDPVKILSHPGVSTHLSRTPVNEILLTDFFGGVASIEVPEPQASTPEIPVKPEGWEQVRSPPKDTTPEASSKVLRPVPQTVTSDLKVDDTPNPVLNYVLGAALLLSGSAWAFIRCY